MSEEFRTVMAVRGMEALHKNSYPGRGVVMGIDQTGKFAVQVYWLMGRSENSRNRILVADDDGCVFAEAADPAKVKDPSLIIYTAMRERGHAYLVSNGEQTDGLAQFTSSPYSFQEGLADYRYEPDAPNFTPRITGICFMTCLDGRRPIFMLSVIRRFVEMESDEALRQLHIFGPTKPGNGLCVTTYKGDRNPLPSFTGDPFAVLLPGDIDNVANYYWITLRTENRIAVAVKFIDLVTGKSQVRLINRNTKVK